MPKHPTFANLQKAGQRKRKLFAVFSLLLGVVAGFWPDFVIAASQSAASQRADEHARFEEALPTQQNLAVAGYSLELINLNPYINRWFILELNGAQKFRIHVENSDASHFIKLTSSGLEFNKLASKHAVKACKLWSDKGIDVLKLEFQKYKNPYFPLCDGLVYARLNRSSNEKLSLTEWGTEILRKSPFGEEVISAFKPYLVTLGGEEVEDKVSLAPNSAFKEAGPQVAQMKFSGSSPLVTTKHQLGFGIQGQVQGMQYGHWYQTKMHPGIYTSLFVPEYVDPAIWQKDADATFPVSQPEQGKLVYLAGYDLARYTLNFVVGTEQPPIETAAQTYGNRAALRNSLVPIGSIPPYDLQQAVGVFIGGFKGVHSIITAGPHAGKRYGYIEKGVELAPLAPGLATVYSTTDGGVHIKLWPELPSEQAGLRKRIVSARQNGTMLVDEGKPGPFIKEWKFGNWSADTQGLRRSLRSAICLQEVRRAEGVWLQSETSEKHLLFFAFTSSSPSTMARVMLAYGCTVGMHLDMNALMYVHNAIYEILEDKSFKVEYLNKDMLYPPDLQRHRFILDNNSRDFFYVLKKDQVSAPRP